MASATIPKPHLAYIDCARGYAVLMVLTTHLTNHFPNLPYPIHRLTITGWFGVQLFFLSSCLTLLMSWNYEKGKTGSVNTAAFFIRRYFRVAPAYYLAGVLYYFLLPPPNGFNVAQALTAMAFINAWTPDWTPTVQHAWYVVPGGWSIGVEFTFYLLFPVFATLVTSRRRAILALAVSIVFGITANLIALRELGSIYQTVALDNFLYFWFPNQLSVFALGGVVYFIICQPDSTGTRLHSFLANHANSLSLLVAATFCFLAYMPLGKYLGAIPYLPACQIASCALAAFLLTLSSNRGLLVNRFAAAMGKVSFSAYLLQFTVLRLFDTFPLLFQSRASGLKAISAFVVGWAIAVSITFALSFVSYHTVERPMIKVGKALIELESRRSLRRTPKSSCPSPE